MLFPKVISKVIIFKVHVHHVFYLKMSGFVLSSWNLIYLEIDTFSILTWKKKKSSWHNLFCRSKNSWKQDIIHLYYVLRNVLGFAWFQVSEICRWHGAWHFSSVNEAASVVSSQDFDIWKEIDGEVQENGF